MEFSLPEGPWADVGIPGHCRIRGLLYNRASESLVAIARSALEEQPPLQRLYYRHLPETTYRAVGIRHPLESQDDALCCEDAPFLIFNELRFREPERVPAFLQKVLKGTPKGFGADWSGIRRVNLETGADELILDREKIHPFPPYTTGRVSRLISVSADGTDAVCTVGLSAGGRVDYFVCELSLAAGLRRTITKLAHPFL